MQTIKLSTTPGVVNPGAYLSQYDVGRQMLFLLYDDVGKYVPVAGSSVHILATKPSGFGFDVACTWSQNAVTVTVTDEMSNESGSFSAELRIEKSGDILGTANFLWNVERSTHPDGTVDGNTEAKGLMQAIMAAITDAENAAAAAAAAALSGLSEDLKQALLDCFAHVAWIDEHGQDYYDALYAALYPPVPATAITLNKSTLRMVTLNATETLTATLTPADSTDTIEWSSSDPTVASVNQNGVVTALDYGSATITATAGAVSAICSVAVTTLSSISAVFTQGAHVVYSDDSLDSLKPYLVVTATYSDSSTEEVPASDYTLSGTLEVGTSTITVTYGEETDTFTVTVTEPIQYYAIVNNLTHVASSNPTVTVEENDSFTTSLGVQTGYTMQSVSVTMGGVDVTAEVYDSDTRTISIAAVTGNVVITAAAVLTPVSISAVFTPGDHTVYEGDSLDSLKPYLVVTATYSDSSTATIPSTDYTLSGTLQVGTSTVTVTYVEETDTFTVTVSAYVPHWENDVFTLTSSDLSRAKIVNTYPYTQSDNNRVSYAGLDVDISTSYTYTIAYETTMQTSTNIGVQQLLSTGYTKVQNHTTLSSGDKNDSGWQNSGYSFSPLADGKCLWITFRAGSGSTAITPADFPSITITREVV